MTRKALWTSLPAYRHTLASRQKHGQKPLKHYTRLKSYVMPRKRSKAMTKRMKIYNQEVKKWLKGKTCAVFPFCVVYQRPNPATQCHHLRGRVGSLLMDKRFWLPVSAEGHNWIHENMEQARKLGFLCAKGQWNNPHTNDSQ